MIFRFLSTMESTSVLSAEPVQFCRGSTLNPVTKLEVDCSVLTHGRHGHPYRGDGIDRFTLFQRRTNCIANADLWKFATPWAYR